MAPCQSPKQQARGYGRACQRHRLHVLAGPSAMRVVKISAVCLLRRVALVLDYVLEQVKGGGYDVIVWDTAPAGDTLRLLDLPHKFLQHLRVAPKVYLGVRDKLRLKQVPFLELIGSWRELAQEITSFFKDPANTAFVLVTIPEALGVYQTQRLVNEFARYGLEVRHLIINHVISEPDSDFLRARQAMQTPYIQLLQAEYERRLDILQVPEFAHEIKGVDRLRSLERVLFGLVT